MGVIFLFNSGVFQESLSCIGIERITLALNNVKHTLVMIADHLPRSILQRDVFVGSVVSQVVEGEDPITCQTAFRESV